MACGCIRKASKFYLIVVNAIFLLAGLAIAATSTYALVRYSALELAIPKNSIIFSICLGVAIFLLSLFGFRAAKHQKKCHLSVYAVLTLAIVVAQCYVGLGVLNYANDTLPEGKTNPVNIDPKINNLLQCSYDLCCEGTGSVETCANFNKWTSSDVCKVLPDAFSTKNAGNCVNYDTYKSALLDWLKSHEKCIGQIVVAFAGMELLTLLFTLTLIFVPRYYGDEASEETEQLYYEQSIEGGQLEYGSTIIGTQPVATATYPAPVNGQPHGGQALTYV